MKNVLFIVYYFPPMGGSGVQRPLKFIKYLRDFDWNPIVIAPEPGAYHTFDNSLQLELDTLGVERHRVAAQTPFHIMGKSAHKVNFIPEWVARQLRKVSTLFYLPDNKTGWITPAIEMASKVIENRNIDVIFSTAPPYSNHIIAQELKSKYQLPVIADFRDDWLDSHLIQYPTCWHYNKMAGIEEKCLNKMDALTVINKKLKESFQKRISQQTPVYVLPQGYDPEDFSYDVGSEKNSIHSDKLVFLYSGIFYGENQPDTFLKAMSNVIHKDKELKGKIEIWFQGGLTIRHINLIKKLGLQEITKNLGYVEHHEAVSNLSKADVLWFIIGQKKNYDYVTTGKFFEYIASHKPIFGLVRDGLITEYLRSYNAHFIAHPENVGAIAEQIQIIYRKWVNKTFSKVNTAFVKQFNRKEITSELCNVLEACLNKSC